MGALTESVRRLMPATYKAMIGPDGETDYYSLADLQALVDYVSFRLFATTAGVTEEETVFDPRQLGFIGKVATLKFIPAAIDFWMDQAETVNTHGPEENETFPSRLASLQALSKALAAEVAEEIDEIVGVAGKTSWAPAVSYGDGGRGILITPDPANTPPLLRCQVSSAWAMDHFLGEEWCP